jgi:ABC-2 type transport system permease protein
MKLRIIPIIHKEFIHIIRDPRSLAIAFLLPIMMILLYGYAITFDVKEIKLGILDQDKSSASRELVDRLTSSHYFKITAWLSNRDEVEPAMLERKILAALVIPTDYARLRQTERNVQLQVLVDGSNSNTAIIAINYIKTFLLTYSLETNSLILKPPLQLQPRVWYNPDLTSTVFIVPGLVAVIMMLICALLTSITIVRERETGTMEQILVSPIHATEIIFGKIVPYVLLALLDAIMIIILARVIFQVPFRGNPLLLLLCSLVYVYAALSLGVFISTRAKTQQVAMIMAQLITTLPSMLLSGFIFPILSMPFVLQLISYLVPARYFLVIIRGIMLKGVGLGYFYQPIIILLIFGTVLQLLSVKRFKTNLEG